MECKTLKVPGGLEKPPYLLSALRSEGLTVVQSCSYVAVKTGIMFLEEHLLLVVLKGTYVIRFGKQEYTLKKNQMVLLSKSIVVEYEKSGDPVHGNTSECMMFFLKDDFVREFVRKIDLPAKNLEQLSPILVNNMTQRLIGFIQSLLPYFNEPDKIDSGLIELKMLELLYGITHTDRKLLQQLLQLDKQATCDISQVVEENYLSPVSISDLAYLSGRSLSSFKRDFKSTYNIPPSRWLRQRRLRKAKELLSNTDMSVTDVCYITGFESVSHFSKVYKSFYGHPPSLQRRQLA
ncbi:MAG TPA: helix-turn-helix transcriptional regulator [Deltaproteobacteria bacterium]|nr:helix-turn-helix transcriptional regulator [Deltaproteobacteria bacterium]